MIALVLSAFMAGAAPFPASLDEAIGLYHAARYAEALEMLDALAAGAEGAPAPADTAAHDTLSEYRALCLLALDREGEAQAAIARLITQRPTYRPRTDELPPRLLTLIERVRAEVLPGIVRSEYREGKASFDRKAYPEAQEHFRQVVALLDGEGTDQVLRESLADVKELAVGFLGIIEKSPPPAASPPLPPPKPVANPASAAPVLYGPADAGVVPPVIVRQDLPRWQSAAAGRTLAAQPSKGVISVTIDAKGQVESAQLITGIHPLYDSRLLAAARNWKYRPATKDGVAVRYRKTIAVTLVDDRQRRTP